MAKLWKFCNCLWRSIMVYENFEKFLKLPAWVHKVYGSFSSTKNAKGHEAIYQLGCSPILLWRCPIKQTNNPKNSLIVPTNIRSMGHFRQQRRIMWFICSEQHHLPCTTRDTIPRYYSIDLEKLNLSLDQEYLIGIENTFSHSMVFSPAFICSIIYDSKLVPHNMVSASAVST